MNRPASNILAMSLPALPIPSNREATRRTCVACDSALVLHQPDQATPGRILGVCTSCHAWTLARSLGRGRYELTLIAPPE
jgi:hypothetical protein